MTEQIKPEGPDEGESTEAQNGGPEFQRTPGKAEGEDPEDSQNTPQAAHEDRHRKNDAQGDLVEPPPTEAG